LGNLHGDSAVQALYGALATGTIRWRGAKRP
jgi:hypothetical protein